MRSVWIPVLLACAAYAQTPTANISGVVQDPTAAAVVAAEVKATSLRTGVTTAARTNESGFFALRQLAIGEYSIEIERAGFRRLVRTGITLSTGQSLELNLRLELGAVSESVTVAASASALETRNAEVSQLVEAKAVEDLPLGDRRAMNLIQMTGAAVFVNYDSGAKPNFSLLGGRSQRQMYWIDGGTAQNMRLGAGQLDLDPPVETLAEVKVSASPMSAEFGGSIGGNIIATTKSGTNQIHGSLFEYLRNDKLDAPDYFAPIVNGEKDKAPLRYNVFGGTVGGPIRRDKTFFYFGYEGARRHDGIVRTLTVPTAEQRAGDFSQTLNANRGVIQIFDPATTVNNVRQPFAGNRVPANRIDPVATKLIPYFPVANRAPDGPTGANNFRANYQNVLTRDNYTAKVDHNIGSKDRITGRYLFNSDNMYNTSVFPDPGADTLNSADRHQNYYYGSWTRIFSPSIVNDLRFTYSNRTNWAKSAGLGGDWATKLGLRGVADGAFPQFSAAGIGVIGSGNQERKQLPIQQWQLVNNLSLIHGRHSFKVGGEVRPSKNYETNRPLASGAFTFSVQPTQQIGNAQTGIGFATLLLGFPTNYQARETEVLDRYSYYMAAFFQDDWSVSRNLTLNFGVRWETDAPLVDRNDRMNAFDTRQTNPVSGTPGVVKFLGINGWRTSPYDFDWNNFGPRFGFAWKPFGATKTVVRGGYGIFFYEPDNSGPNGASLGFEKSITLNSPDNGITAPFYLRDGVPGGTNLSKPELNDAFGAVRVGQQATTAVTFFETDRATGYSQQFSLGMQYELPGNLLLDLSYVGHIGRKHPGGAQTLNQINPSILGPGRSTQQFRPYPQFSQVQVINPLIGSLWYNAGVARLERRFARGFSVLGTYTWAKSLNDTPEGTTIGVEGDAYSNAYNRRADWGPSANDIRHRLTVASVYELPFGKGRRWLADNPLRYLVGNWSIGTLGTFQAAAPFTVATQTNTTNAFSAGALRADVLRNPNLSADERRLERWFDTGAFTQPAIYQFGNQGVNILRGDGIVNFDFSLLRNFQITERVKLQFRAESFNAFNHPNFEEPGRAFGGPGFGIVSAAGPARRLQFGLRIVF